MNAARPITSGGTGGTSAATARDALGLEIGVDIPAFTQIGSSFNLGLAVSVAGNALTIALKGADGNDPSATNPINVPFRSATAATGTVTVRTITAATSLVVSSGSTLGTTSAVKATLAIVGFDDAGTFRLGVVNPGALRPVMDGIASSTAEGGAGAADSLDVFYTGTAVASKAYTVLGYIEITEATAGTWATAPSLVQVAPAAQAAMPLLPFTKEYVSAEQTITAGAVLVLAHGLVVAPKLITAELVCKTAEYGYAIGAVINIDIGQKSTSIADAYGTAVVKDATNVTLVMGSAAGVFNIIRADTFAAGTITAANWRLIVRAWA